MQASLASLLVLVLCAAGRVSAQLPEFQTGARVRVHTTGAAEPLTGTIAYQTPSELAVLRAPDDTAVVSLAAISRVDVSGGRRSNALRGAKLGALIGAGVGAALGMAAMAENDGFIDYGAEAIPAGMLGGGILGGAVGLLFGAATGSERWVPAIGAVAVMPGADGVAVSASFRF
jgi:hypothetical protein